MDRTHRIGETVRPEPRWGAAVQYDTFISYGHAADGRLAPAIRNGVRRVAPPGAKRCARREFRDETETRVDPDDVDATVSVRTSLPGPLG